jgi:hypothetical protein
VTDTWVAVEVAARLTRVRVETIRVWATREKVRTVQRGRVRLVNLTDVRHAERAWRQRAWRKDNGMTERSEQ